jgi:formate-dependent phosphoribosylglycinamide formyltransferase (GAR transformylase)
MRPKVLIATTSRWFPTVRLAMALANAGFTVEPVCLPGHPLRKTRAAHRIHTFHALMPLRSLKTAIEQTDPDLIIPGDDLATQHLHALYARELKRGGREAYICGLIERSLGAPSGFPLVYARSNLLEIASKESIRVPKTKVVTNIAELREWAKEMTFPVVLKSDGTSGGEGVRIVHSMEDAERSFRDLHALPLFARAAKRALVDGDKTLVWPSILRKRSVVNIQTLVAGHEATSTLACWKGSVLASLHFEVLNKAHSTGHATVVRLVEHPDLSSAAEKIVRRLGLSGLIGLDFMIEKDTGNAHLIELNPRATQVGHLTLGPSRDLPAALYAAVTGTVVQEAPKLTEKATIALFPQEWKRNPESAALHSGYHDVPWEEPELVRACLRRPRNHSARISQQDSIQAFSPVRLPRS